MGTSAKWILGVATAVTVAMAFLYLPPAAGFQQPELARLVALHLPNALVVLVAAATGGVFAGRYLRHRRPIDDAQSLAAAQLATLFCLLTTVTGMLFARAQWGAYWNWDPKQTCIFLLLLIYAAYFLLRASVDDPEKRATLGAAYYLFAATMTPLLGYLVPKYLPSLHPTGTKFSPEYHTVIWSFSACLTGLYAWLQGLAGRYERARLALEAWEDG